MEPMKIYVFLENQIILKKNHVNSWFVGLFFSEMFPIVLLQHK